MNALITREYQGHTFTFREDGYFNMTKAAKHFGKYLDDFWRLNETKEYMCALVEVLHANTADVRDLNLDVQSALNEYEKGQHSFITHKETRALKALLAETAKGHGGGTWAHPKLAVFFARWLDVRFAVWCDLMVDEILRGRLEVQPVAAQVTQDRGLEDVVKAILPVLLPEVVRMVREALPQQPQSPLSGPVRQLLEVTRKVSIVTGARKLSHLAQNPVSDERLTVREYLYEEGYGSLSRTTVGDIGGKARMLCCRLGIPVEERQGAKVAVGYYPREVISKAVELVLDERG